MHTAHILCATEICNKNVAFDCVSSLSLSSVMTVGEVSMDGSATVKAAGDMKSVLAMGDGA